MTVRVIPGPAEDPIGFAAAFPDLARIYGTAFPGKLADLREQARGALDWVTLEYGADSPEVGALLGVLSGDKAGGAMLTRNYGIKPSDLEGLPNEVIEAMAADRMNPDRSDAALEYMGRLPPRFPPRDGRVPCCMARLYGDRCECGERKVPSILTPELAARYGLLTG